MLTHYGTEIWHHDGKDPRFRRLNREARHVTFYSRALLERARELEVPLPAASVVYPPVADAFLARSSEARAAARRRHVRDGEALLLNVNGFFDPMLAWVRQAAAEGFIRQQHVDLLDVASDVDGLLDVLSRRRPAAPVTKWADRDDR